MSILGQIHKTPRGEVYRNPDSRLRMAILRVGLRATARKAGVDSSQLSKYQSGKSGLNREMAERVAKALGFDV